MANPGSEQVIVLLRGDSLDLIRASAKSRGFTISKTIQGIIDEFYLCGVGKDGHDGHDG